MTWCFLVKSLPGKITTKNIIANMFLLSLHCMMPSSTLNRLSCKVCIVVLDNAVPIIYFISSGQWCRLSDQSFSQPLPFISPSCRCQVAMLQCNRYSACPCWQWDADIPRSTLARTAAWISWAELQNYDKVQTAGGKQAPGAVERQKD